MTGNYDPDHWQKTGNTIVKGSLVLFAIFVVVLVILQLLGLLPNL